MLVKATSVKEKLKYYIEKAGQFMVGKSMVEENIFPVKTQAAELLGL